MPLPALHDALFTRQLAVIVTAGWQLPFSPHLEPGISYWLEAVPLRRRAGSYRLRAHDLLWMLDEALVAGSEAPEPSTDSLLTTDQALGLRILFGLHPDYRDATAGVRRDNAAEYLGGSRRGGGLVSGATLYKRRQEELLQLTLDAFRNRFGQDPEGIKSAVEVENVLLVAKVDEHGRVVSVFSDYTLRARFADVVDFSFRAALPTGAIGRPRVTEYTGVHLKGVREWAPGHLGVDVASPDPLRLGERRHVGLRLTYAYPDGFRPNSGHIMHWEQQPNFRLSMILRFTSPPTLCWHYGDSLLRYPTPYEEALRLFPDDEGSYRWRWLATAARLAYGLAWTSS